MKATLRQYRQAPRKVRLVADFIRGKTVAEADTALSLMPKKAAAPLRKLLASALANRQQAGEQADAARLRIETIEVNQGHVFVRFQARARGRATPIRKKTSHVTVRLTPNT